VRLEYENETQVTDLAYMTKKTTLGILTIATNSYVSYWKNQAASINAHLNTDLDITLHVFTDDVAAVSEYGAKLDIRVEAHPIPSYGWPEATLYRYRVFYEHQHLMKQDLLMYLDADMLVKQGFTHNSLNYPLGSGVCLVLHPGYYRPQRVKMLMFYLRNMSLIISDLRSLLVQGGIGSWETNRHSLAYVPRHARKKYFCGGIWWGRRDDVVNLCHVLSVRVAADESKGVEAVWHDESHLNWWATQETPGFESPRFCYAEGHPQLNQLEQFVIAVDKSSSPNSNSAQSAP
jgi:hypothetical protein